MINLLVYNIVSVSLPKGAIICDYYKDMFTMKKDPVTVKNNETRNII